MNPGSRRRRPARVHRLPVIRPRGLAPAELMKPRFLVHARARRGCAGLDDRVDTGRSANGQSGSTPPETPCGDPDPQGIRPTWLACPSRGWNESAPPLPDRRGAEGAAAAGRTAGELDVLKFDFEKPPAAIGALGTCAVSPRRHRTGSNEACPRVQSSLIVEPANDGCRR